MTNTEVKKRYDKQHTLTPYTMLLIQVIFVMFCLFVCMCLLMVLI